MELNTKSSIILALALSSLLSLYVVEAKDTAVARYCSESESKSQCESIISSFVSSGNGSQILEEGLKALSEQTESAIADAERLSREIPAGRKADRFDICVAYYHVLSASAKRAAEAVQKKDYKRVAAELKSGIEAIDSCDDLFPEEADGQKGSLDDVNASLSVIAKFSNAIAKSGMQ